MKRIILGLAIVSQILLGEGNAQELISRVFPYQSGVYGTLVSVSAGEVLEVYSYSFQGSSPQIVTDLTSGEISAVSGFPNSTGTTFPFRIAGPAIVRSPSVSGSLFMTYKKTSNTSTSASTPANAVVIPTDATGSVQIILESSTDLITWTQANPGTYGASTAKRFFRIRAVNQ